ncbi:MAG: S-adenosylmethionine:tRNA ribosyltransferase-isomerase, partial [Candidatus Rokubacteria bacterium]|nr:S-adenosylmethionine:tRNA ribosyltransferase-isomerase [Candidatus Rokubacteria bacterium]
FEALVRARGRLRVGQKLRFARAAASADAEIAELSGDGRVVLRFAAGTDPYALGEMPLPPYIKRASENADDVARYQTVFARAPGSVAAPTAGLHFSDALFAALRARGVRTAEVVLHVGIGTFRPLREEDLAAGELHSERFELSEETVRAISETRGRGGRVVAVGTTSTRVLESCADERGGVIAKAGETRLLLAPGARFRVVDALLTNFHLPRSSLLLLVAAFAGREPVLAAYREAVALGYRFYSYGDAMLLS